MEELLQRLSATANLDEALALVIEDFHAESGTIHLMGEDGQLHLTAASKGIPPVVLDIVRVVPVGKGMAGLAAERAQPVTVCNLQTNTSGDARPGAKATGMEGAIVVPMFVGERVAGTLGIANRHERTFTEEETSALLAAGRLLAAR
jgi:L-methionine (R)-S-oxide reductase